MRSKAFQKISGVNKLHIQKKKKTIFSEVIILKILVPKFSFVVSDGYHISNMSY